MRPRSVGKIASSADGSKTTLGQLQFVAAGHAGVGVAHGLDAGGTVADEPRGERRQRALLPWQLTVADGRVATLRRSATGIGQDVSIVASGAFYHRSGLRLASGAVQHRGRLVAPL